MNAQTRNPLTHKYLITYDYFGSITIEVEAEDEEQAKMLAAEDGNFNVINEVCKVTNCRVKRKSS